MQYFTFRFLGLQKAMFTALGMDILLPTGRNLKEIDLLTHINF